MELKIDQEKSSHKILIVDYKNSPLSFNLKTVLKKYENEIFISPHFPKIIQPFDIVFSLNQKVDRQKLVGFSDKKIVLVFFNDKKEADRYLKFLVQQSLKQIKIINIEGDSNLSAENINNLLWFIYSHTDEKLLNIYQMEKNTRQEQSVNKSVKLPKINIKKTVFLLMILLVLYHLLFFPFLLATSYSYYQSIKYLRSDQKEKSQLYFNQGTVFLSISKNLYQKTQYLFRLFSLSAPLDDLFSINERTASFLKHSEIIYENSRQVIKLFMKKDKSTVEKNALWNTVNSLDSELENLDEEIVFLNQKIPRFIANQKKIEDDLDQAGELIKKLRRFLPHLKELLAYNTTKKYLLLFTNNMEIRPGGGFIGSFGVLTISNLTLTDLTLYDVYDADGQLIGHVEPPEPIKKYLNQPHWFLRDSAFSGDFSENFNTASFFLKKEMNMSEFDGAILFTTSSIQNILKGYKKFYLPDYKEFITADNFYLKAQLYSEKNFFPGSTQKKNFLGSIARYLLLNMEDASTVEIAKEIKRSLDEKQIAILFKNKDIQPIIDSLYWSGKIIEPQCPPNLENCFSDYFFPLDANLGVNKANLYITRSIESNISFDNQGFVHNKLIFRYENSSPQSVFPGGPYQNYFQLLLPVNSLVKEVTKNGVLVEDLDQSIDRFKKVGFFFVLQPQTSAEIKIDYQSTVKLEKGRGYYQLLAQKQIGYSNDDMIIRINLPKNIHIINQNFSPLVKDGQIIYNTQLSADKIFFIELSKE